METWFGRREGVEGAVKNHGADRAFSVDKFAADLGKLLDGHDKLYYRFGVDEKLDMQIIHYLSAQRQRRLKSPYPPHTIIDPTILIHEMRLHKTPDEVQLMQKAATISAEAHILAMRKTRPGMNEFQVESMIEAYMRDNGASGVAYNSIVGGGENATILHYVENNRRLNDGDLLLVDAGAEYQGYAADITRTFPINGKYSKAQREVYDVVLDVQLQCIEATITGNTVAKRAGAFDRTAYRRHEKARPAERKVEGFDKEKGVYEILYARRRPLSRDGRPRRRTLFYRSDGQKLASLRARNGPDRRTRPVHSARRQIRPC